MKHEALLAGDRLELALKTLDAAGLAALDPAEWDALAGEALHENPFYSRQYVLGGLNTIDRSVRIEAVEMRSRENRLVALFPFIRRWGTAALPHNLYQFSGTPLINKDLGAQIVTAWLDAISSGRLPAVWRLRDIRTDGGLAELIRELAAYRGMEARAVNEYDRSLLTRVDGGFEGHMTSILSKSRRKDIERAMRRLREDGELRFERAETPEAVHQRLEEFLLLERAGWKGESGSAFLCNADHASFARAAFAASCGGRSPTTIDALLLDDRPIALSINIASGKTAFTAKCTYDEAYRKRSPGLVLEYLVIQHFYADERFTAMDSCTTVGGHVVEGLWNKTGRMGELFVGKPGAVQLAAASSASYARAKSAAKRILQRFH